MITRSRVLLQDGTAVDPKAEEDPDTVGNPDVTEIHKQRRIHAETAGDPDTRGRESGMGIVL
jgi:hypothetical protein